MIKGIVGLFLLSVVMNGTVVLASPSEDDLQDITDGVVPIVEIKRSGAQSGTGLTSVSEVEYTVRVKNQTGDPVVADSLILVVDMVTEITGHEISDGVEIEGYDGLTAAGKPFFRVPSSEQELAPFSVSEPVTIRVSNPNFHRYYPPTIRVHGLRRSAGEAVKGLLESLVKKGILAPEEAVKALNSTTPPAPADTP